MSVIKIFILFLFMFQVSAKSLGEIQFFTYLDGLPLKNKNLVVDGKDRVQTNDEGVLTLELKSGSHFVEIIIDEKITSIPFTIAPKELTQITLNLFSNNQLEIDANDPHYTGVKSEQSNLPKSLLNLKIVEKGKGSLKGAKIYISGQSNIYQSDKLGEVKVDLPIGTHTVSIVQNKYNTEVFKVKIEKEKIFTRKVEMTPAGLELDEFIVIAPQVGGSLQALIEVRKNSDRVADVIGSEQMRKSGDSNAGASLRRVTGITLVNGKYVYVRGLGERYSSILMNQSTLPSPDPTRKVVPLDIFPSGILESMVIQKSYSPDLPGEFGGGTVILNTKNIPDQFDARIQISTNYDSGPSQHMTYAGGNRDWLGMDDGTRALPYSLARATEGTNRITPFSPLNPGGKTSTELMLLGSELNNQYDMEKTRPGPPPNLNLSIGDRFLYKGNKFGYFTSMMYSNRWVTDNSQRTTYLNGLGGLAPFSESKIESSEHTINLGGMLNLGADFGNYFKLKLNTLLLRKTTDRTRDTFRTEEDIDVRTTTFEWTERQLFSQIARGDHEFGDKDFGINWLYSFSEATLYKPDERDYRYRYGPDYNTYIFDNTVGSNNRRWNDLTDRNHNAQLAFKAPIYRAKSFKLKMKTGLAYTYKDRKSEGESFRFDINESVPVYNEQTGSTLRPEQIFNQENLNNGNMVLVNSTLPSDSYSAEQRIRAGFLDSEINIGEWLTYNMGIRYERSHQLVNTSDLITGDAEQASLEMVDYLPVYAMTFRLPYEMQLRMGYSETVSRPDFKELSNSPYYDNERREMVIGNTELLGTVIKNYDIRYEWYFGKKENISLGFFRKEFENPIENVIVNAQSSFDNIPTAENTGLEFEFRKNFAFIKMRDLSLSGNAAFIHSEVDVGEQTNDGLTSKNRPMQGQSPYVVNVNLEYEKEDWGTQATMLYNIFGKRIVSVGTESLPDIYERPFHQLDFVFSQQIKKKTQFRFKAQNLINPEAKNMQGDKISELYRKGRAFSAGVSIRI